MNVWVLNTQTLHGKMSKSKLLKITLFLALGILIFSLIIHKIPLPKFQKAEILSLSEAKPRILPENSSLAILEELTIEQKVGQLFIIGFEGQEINQELKDLIKNLHPGGILLLKRNIENREQVKNLIQDLQKTALEDTGLPLFIAVDQEGGEICRIPFLDCTSQSEIQDKEQAFQLGSERAKALKELGINLNLAPVLDNSAAADFIYQRTFQTNTEKAGDLAKDLILGQKARGILTAIKHFPGYGNINFNPETEKLAIFSEIPEISQFQKAMQAQPEMVMIANAIYLEIAPVREINTHSIINFSKFSNGVDKNLPFSLSAQGIEFLKQKLGKEILIISDDLSSPVLKKEFSLETTIILAQKAGLDILLASGFWDAQDPAKAYNVLLKEAQEGRIFQQEIDKAILRIIKLKQNLKP